MREIRLPDAENALCAVFGGRPTAANAENALCAVFGGLHPQVLKMLCAAGPVVCGNRCCTLWRGGSFASAAATTGGAVFGEPAAASAENALCTVFRGLQPQVLKMLCAQCLAAYSRKC